MLRYLSIKTFVLLCTTMILINNCASYRTVKREITPKDSYQTLDNRSPFLKAHMKNGTVYVVSDWRVDTNEKMVAGFGALLSVNRDTLKHGEFSIPIDSVIVFETNVLQESSAVAALSIITGISAAVTIACLTNPKACFGSCPTFYASDGNRLILQAEGFSSSIAPSLEASDVDALFRAKSQGRKFILEMRNEALETHVVRYVDLLVLPRPRGGRVFKDINGKFWQARGLLPPTSCIEPGGECLSLLRSFDGKERFSLADSINLAKREILEVEFENTEEGPVGLVIGARQTLLSTYLLYQTFAWMGSRIGDWFALFGQKKHDPSKSRLGNLLGRIEVLVQDGQGSWQSVGEAGEHGPLATDTYLIPLPSFHHGKTTKVRLRLTKGNWRIDYLALAKLEGEVTPIRVKPYSVINNGIRDKDALATLCDSTKVLTTLPGDTYTLEYLLPEDMDGRELFLESRGYYLEWMRQEWLDEENPEKLARMFYSTETALRDLAPEFKKSEHSMEDAFWRSRYAKP